METKGALRHVHLAPETGCPDASVPHFVGANKMVRTSTGGEHHE